MRSPLIAPGHRGPPLRKTVRLRLCILCAVGFALVYALRVNLSIAIVAMVKESTHTIVNVSFFKASFSFFSKIKIH